MKFQHFWVLILAGFLALGGFVAWQKWQSQSSETLPAVKPEDRAGTRVLAEIGDSLSEKQAAFGPFAAFLSSKLAESGVKQVVVAVAKSPAEMAKLVRQGKVDIYVDSPFPSYIVNKLAGAEPMDIRWKKGLETYHSIIFVPTTSAVRTLDDLRGTMIAFEKPDSTSAYFLPKAELLKRGYTLVRKEKPTDPVEPGEIGYYFTFDDKKVVADVGSGVADAGGQNEEEFVEFAGKSRGEFRFLLTTTDVYRHVLSVRRDLDPTQKESLRQLLLSLDGTAEGREALAQFEKTAKFTPSPVGQAGPWAQIAALASLVEREILGEE